MKAYCGGGDTYLIYNCYEVFFDFNGRYYITAIDKCSYDVNAKTVKYTNTDFRHLLEIDINDDFKMKEVTNYFAPRNNPETNDLYNKIRSIVNGDAWTNANKIYIQTNNEWYSSSNIINWNKETNGKPADVKQKAKTELYKIPIKARNGKTYTYVYASEGRKFSITRLTNRMRQQANRLEYKFNFNNEDFNNHHMFDLGLNTDGSTNAKFRLNPTNYIGNDTNYVYMGATSAGQIWLMPIKKDGKDYLIRLPEHGGPEMYLIDDLKNDMISYKAKYQESLAKSLALSSANANINDIRNAAYETIFNDANYKANKYFLDVVSNMGAKGGEDGIYVSSSKPISHYVIEITDIE